MKEWRIRFRRSLGAYGRFTIVVAEQCNHRLQFMQIECPLATVNDGRNRRYTCGSSDQLELF